jgi:hypothetical protein
VLADTVNPLAEKDNTLYEDEVDDLSNGAGDHLFTGLTNTPLIRRAVIKFDIDGAIPADATIDSVQLTLNVSRNNNATPEDTSLHRLNSDWGESGSNASSTAGMVADVQQWLDQPASNFGWVIIGNESGSATSKRFDSREILDGNTPGLVVRFTPAPPAGSCCTGFICQVVTKAECTGLNGAYGGDDTICEPNPCDPAGACCASSGDCTDTTLSLCLDGGGFFQSPGSSCAQILECPVFEDGFEDS